MIITPRDWLIAFSTESGSPAMETEVLVKIIQLDIAKIRRYVKDLRNSKDIFKDTIATLESRLVEALPGRALPSTQKFLDWFEKIYEIQNLPSEPDPGILLRFIKWSLRAKHPYRNLLMVAFSTGNQPLPRWVRIILKLGRYGVAAKALVRTAIELPALFNPIFVEPVPAPPKTQPTIQEQMPLTCALRRIPKIKPEIAIPRLAGIWNTRDAESEFRKSFPKELAAHAELQIVNFYDHNPQRKPFSCFIGLSKKCCYLCSKFFAAHPSNFHVSSCHQKLYLSWIMPPAVDPEIYRQNKAITNEMSKKMEAIAKQDLVQGLGLRRFPIPADSTAGVSLTGLTDATSLGFIDLEDHDESYVDLGIDTVTGQHDFTFNATVPESDIVSHSVDLTAQIPDPQQVNRGDMSLLRTGQQFARQDSQMSISSMVFHFKRYGDKMWHEIVMIGSVLDPVTHSPSWSKLVELLNQDGDGGVVFQHSNVLIINECVWVRNERQFIACLQYLLNSGILNSEVLICDGRSKPRNPSSQDER